MTMARTKWMAVLESALAELSGGAFPQGARFYTMDQFCEKYRISEITGRRVFKELKQRGLITTNGRGGTLVSGCPRGTDVYMCLRNDSFADGEQCLIGPIAYQQFLAGFQSGQFSELYHVIPLTLDSFLAHLDDLHGKTVIVSGESLLDITPYTTARLNHARLQRVRQYVEPIIFHSFGDIPDYAELSNVVQVSPARRAGIRQVVARLVRAGHSRIGYFTGSLNTPWFYPRFLGYTDGLYLAGIALDTTLIAHTSGVNRAEDVLALQAMLQQPHPPTAIVCANDTRAIHILDYCREQRIAVPDTLAVTGFDNSAESAFTGPPLTTVSPNNTHAGKTVLNLVHQQLTGKLIVPQNILIEPELIVRASA